MIVILNVFGRRKCHHINGNHSERADNTYTENPLPLKLNTFSTTSFFEGWILSKYKWNSAEQRGAKSLFIFTTLMTIYI